MTINEHKNAYHLIRKVEIMKHIYTVSHLYNSLQEGDHKTLVDQFHCFHTTDVLRTLWKKRNYSYEGIFDCTYPQNHRRKSRKWEEGLAPVKFNYNHFTHKVASRSAKEGRRKEQRGRWVFLISSNTLYWWWYDWIRICLYVVVLKAASPTLVKDSDFEPLHESTKLVP